MPNPRIDCPFCNEQMTATVPYDMPHVITWCVKCRREFTASLDVMEANGRPALSENVPPRHVRRTSCARYLVPKGMDLTGPAEGHWPYEYEPEEPTYVPATSMAMLAERAAAPDPLKLIARDYAAKIYEMFEAWKTFPGGTVDIEYHLRLALTKAVQVVYDPMAMASMQLAETKAHLREIRERYMAPMFMPLPEPERQRKNQREITFNWIDAEAAVFERRIYRSVDGEEYKRVFCADCVNGTKHWQCTPTTEEPRAAAGTFEGMEAGIMGRLAVVESVPRLEEQPDGTIVSTFDPEPSKAPLVATKKCPLCGTHPGGPGSTPLNDSDANCFKCGRTDLEAV